MLPVYPVQGKHDHLSSKPARFAATVHLFVRADATNWKHCSKENHGKGKSLSRGDSSKASA